MNNQNVKLTEVTKCEGITFKNCVVRIRVGAEVFGCAFDNCIIVGFYPFIESLKASNDFKNCTQK